MHHTQYRAMESHGGCFSELATSRFDGTSSRAFKRGNDGGSCIGSYFDELYCLFLFCEDCIGSYFDELYCLFLFCEDCIGFYYVNIVFWHWLLF